MSDALRRAARSVRAPIFVGLGLGLGLAVAAGCGEKPTRWDEVQKETRRNQPAVSKEALAGGMFNKFFPKGEGDYELVPAQEKAGFAEYKLKKGGKEVATLAIFDTVSNPAALDKFKDAPGKLEGYPVADEGKSATVLLVADRFQVKVRSTDANFGPFDREDWLKKFDLANLARLQ